MGSGKAGGLAISGLGLSVSEEGDSGDTQPELCFEITSASLGNCPFPGATPEVSDSLVPGMGPWHLYF